MAISSVAPNISLLQRYPSAIKETPKNYHLHDQLFKELLHNFFEEFLEAFFPEVHHYVDFSSVKPLSEEVFTDLLKGSSKRADVVVEAKLKGEETLFIIHVESQSTYESNFAERMFHYFTLLYNKYRKPILPIAIFSYDETRTEQNQFIIEFPFYHVLTFNILMLELKKKNWRKFIESDNPVAAALMSKMGYSEKEKVEVKKEFLKMLVRMELNPAQSRFINAFFETYLILNEKEEERLMEEIKQLDNAEEIMNLPNSWEERGYKRGIEQGIEQGMQKGVRKVIENMLKKDFSMEVIAEVTGASIGEIEKLKRKMVL